MKLKLLLAATGIFCTSALIFGQNVGVSTNGSFTPTERLHVDGNARIDNALIVNPQTTAAAATITVATATTAINITAVAGVQANAITYSPTPTAGQLMYIHNADGDAATFASFTIPATGFGTFLYLSGGWRAVSIGSGGGPSGTAGGDLTGSYPNPSVGTGTITSAKIADGTITGTDIAAGTVANSNLVNSSLTVTAGTGLTGGGTVSLGGSVTLNAADASATNELQTISASGSGPNYAVDLSNSGGTITFAPGNGIGLSRSGNTITTGLTNVGTAGTYGSATQVPVLTTDAQGRVTAVTNTTITGTSPVGSSLTNSYIWIGNVSNQAAAVDPTGDVDIANNGTMTIQANAVTSSKIADGTITSADISDGTVASVDITDGTVATVDIANSNVTYGKIQNVSASRLLGNPTGSSAAPSEISLGTGLSFAGTVLNTVNNGTVTSITAGTGLSGGTITTSGTISMPNVGTAGTYGSATQIPVLTTDAQGRVTGVTNTAITGLLSGGTTNYLPKWTSASALSSTSLVYDNGSSVGINTSSPTSGMALDVNGAALASKYVVQNATDGTNARGIWMWTATDANWGIYMGQSGAGKSLANGTATTGAYGGTSHSIRIRTYNDPNNGFIYENSAEQTNFAVRASDGSGYFRGNLGVGVVSPSYKVDATAATSRIGSFVNTVTSADYVGVYGSTNNTPYYGYGVQGYGGYMGVYGNASLSGTGTRFGVYGYGTGGTSSNYGVYGTASGTDAWGLYTPDYAYVGQGAYFRCSSCGSTSTINGSSDWGTLTVQGRVLSTNSNLHLSPPGGSKVIINSTYRAAGGSTGTTGLQIEDGGIRMNKTIYFFQRYKYCNCYGAGSGTWDIGNYDFCAIGQAGFKNNQSNADEDDDYQCAVWPIDVTGSVPGEQTNYNTTLSYNYASKPYWRMYAEAYEDANGVTCAANCINFE